MIILRKFKLIGLDPQGGIGNIIARFFHLVGCILLYLMMSVFFVLNIHDDAHKALSVLPVIFLFTSLIADYSHLVINRQSVYSLLDELQGIVKQRAKKEENEMIYARAEQRISYATNIILKFVVSVPVFPLSPFLLAAYHWCLGKYSTDSWVFFYSVWTPFDLNTVSRCALMVLFQTISATSGTIILCIVSSLLIVFIVYSEACLEDIKHLILQVDRLSRWKDPEPSKQKNFTVHERQNAERALEAKRINLELKMLEHFKEAADLHRKVIRLIENLAKVMNFIILMGITPYALSACLSLLVIEKYSGTNFLYDMQLLILALVLTLILLAFLYYMGQRFHSNLMDLNVAVYQSEWYQYPRSVRRFVLLMMMRSQQPFYFSAYGLVNLNLETFVGLLKWMYSVLMLLRGMDQE